MRGDSRWNICPSCARPCLPYPDGNQANSSKPGYESIGRLPNSLRCCSPLRGSCRKVNPEPRWGCACSGRALTRQSQRCLLCSPPSIFPVGEHRELIMGSTNGLFIKRMSLFPEVQIIYLPNVSEFPGTF